MAPSFIGGSGIDKMKDAVELSDTVIAQVGKDFKIVSYPMYK
jgi:diaminohydroxyphosphoribosylaminopyrimidine deaminase/5-amino-6-(5-phosphoribosylamino)uracil reductase